jgi:phosphate starvation-inducible membrane PsiE
MINLKEIDKTGNFLVGVFHRLALFAIGASTVYAAGWTFIDLFNKHHASIQDLLLLFIYLELGAMVGIYFKTNHMPVRFLIYIAITALTRHLVDLVTHPNNIMEIVGIGCTTLILSISVLIIRYGSNKYPNEKNTYES